MVADEKTITTVRRYLNETIPAGGSAEDTALTEADVAMLVESARTTYGAAAQGWRLKAASSASTPGELKKYSIGQESYEKTTSADYAAYCLEMARMYDKMESKETAYGGSLVLGIRRPIVI